MGARRPGWLPTDLAPRARRGLVLDDMQDGQQRGRPPRGPGSGSPAMVHGVERVREHRMAAVRARRLRRLCRRERQVVTRSAPDDEERPDPIQQSEIDCRRRCRRQHDDESNGEYFVNRHFRHLHTRLPDSTNGTPGYWRSGLSRPFEHLRRLAADPRVRPCAPYAPLPGIFCIVACCGNTSSSV